MLQEGEIIGLDDMIIQEKYVFSLDCVSKAEYFSINRHVNSSFYLDFDENVR